MAEGTSVGSVQMDIEINQKSLEREMRKVNTYISNGFKNMFSGMASQNNSFVKNSLGKMNSGFKNYAQTGTGANEKVSRSISRMNTQYEKTEERIKKIQKELLNLDAQRDAIINNYKDMPAFTGMTKDESLEQMLMSDSSFEELTDKIEGLSSELEPLIVKKNLLGDEIKNVGDAAHTTGSKLSLLGSSSKKAGNEAKKSSFKLKLFGDEMKECGVKAAGFAAMINRSFRTILRRIFVYSLIMKGIRGIMSHMGAALNTNKQFVSSLNIVKTNLRVAFQPIYDFILPALNALMRAVATVTTYIASAISALFGKSYQQSFNAAKGLEASKKAMDGYGKSAEKARGALAGFDEINQLDISDDKDGGSGAGGFEMEMPDTSTIDLTGFGKLKDMLQPTIDSFKNLGLALEPLKGFVSTGLQDFYNNFLLPVGQWTLGEGLPRFIDAITKGLLGIQWDTINASLNNLWIALTPFAINIGEGLLWFWENALVPLGTWTMNEVVPRFLDILSEAIIVLNNVIEALKPLGVWLWESFLKPLAEWTGGVIVSILDGIKEGLKSISDWISKNQGTVQTLAIITGGFAAAWGLVNIAVSAWNIIGVIATGVTKAFGAAMAVITSPIGLVTLAIGAVIAIGVLLYKHWEEIGPWIKDTWEGIKIKATEVWGAIKNFFVETWDNIKKKTEEVWNNIKSFLESKIWNPIKTTASNIFNSIKDTISNIFNSIRTTTTTIWNNIIGGLKASFDTIYSSAVNIFSKMKDFIKGITDNISGFFKGMVNGVIEALNSMINGLNRLNVDIPSWVPGLGGKSLGFNLPNIPMLAKGGIIDQPTLAMVGERGKEAVIPFEDSGFLEALTGSIVNALLQIMPLMSGQGNNESYDDKELVLNIEGTPLVRILLPLINNELSRLGYKTLFQVN